MKSAAGDQTRFHSLCFLGLPLGQKIKNHLKGAQQPRMGGMEFAGVWRVLECFCLFICACGNVWVCRGWVYCKINRDAWSRHACWGKASANKCHETSLGSNLHDIFKLTIDRRDISLQRGKRREQRERKHEKESLCEERLWKTFCGAITKAPQKTQWHRNVN